MAAPFVARGARPRVAILREQGVNGQIEMAAAFTRAGFEAVDVHMSDMIEGRARLATSAALAACGGFSYGDVLGAGEGWAQVDPASTRARASGVRAFFARADTFALGVCNGCQMLSRPARADPGRRTGRASCATAPSSSRRALVAGARRAKPLALLRRHGGLALPIAVAHGEGRAELRATRSSRRSSEQAGRGALRRRHGRSTERYPANPNGSPNGIAALTTPDGRVTIIMPHPERVFRTVQHSLASARVGRGRPVDAPVPQRARLGRLTRARSWGADAGPTGTPQNLARQVEVARQFAGLSVRRKLLVHAGAVPGASGEAGAGADVVLRAAANEEQHRRVRIGGRVLREVGLVVGNATGFDDDDRVLQPHLARAQQRRRPAGELRAGDGIHERRDAGGAVDDRDRGQRRRSDRADARGASRRRGPWLA